MAKQKSYIPGTHPDLPPPRSEAGILGWMRQNLFATWTDTLLTLFGSVCDLQLPSGHDGLDVP